jgi:hypothetical protein
MFLLKKTKMMQIDGPASRWLGWRAYKPPHASATWEHSFVREVHRPIDELDEQLIGPRRRTAPDAPAETQADEQDP